MFGGCFKTMLCGAGRRRKCANNSGSLSSTEKPQIMGNTAHVEEPPSGAEAPRALEEQFAEVVPPNKEKEEFVEKATDPVPPFDFGSCYNMTFAVLLGLIGGFLNGFCGVPLAGFLLYTLSTGIPKDLWRSCNAAMLTLVTPIGLYYYYQKQGGFVGDDMALYAVSAVSTIVAVPLGNIISKHVNQQVFVKALMLLMFAGSALLIVSGTGVVPVIAISLITLLIPVGSFICSFYKHLEVGPQGQDEGVAHVVSESVKSFVSYSST